LMTTNDGGLQSQPPPLNPPPHSTTRSETPVYVVGGRRVHYGHTQGGTNVIQHSAMASSTIILPYHRLESGK
jgi:hypothetical protein